MKTERTPLPTATKERLCPNFVWPATRYSDWSVQFLPHVERLNSIAMGRKKSLIYRVFSLNLLLFQIVSTAHIGHSLTLRPRLDSCTTSWIPPYALRRTRDFVHFAGRVWTYFRSQNYVGSCRGLARGWGNSLRIWPWIKLYWISSFIHAWIGIWPRCTCMLNGIRVEIRSNSEQRTKTYDNSFKTIFDKSF